MRSRLDLAISVAHETGFNLTPPPLLCCCVIMEPWCKFNEPPKNILSTQFTYKYLRNLFDLNFVVKRKSNVFSKDNKMLERSNRFQCKNTHVD